MFAIVNAIPVDIFWYSHLLFLYVRQQNQQLWEELVKLVADYKFSALGEVGIRAQLPSSELAGDVLEHPKLK